MRTLKELKPKARKEHKCELCGGVIVIGEKYERQTNNYDGKLYDCVCHCECSQVASELRMFDYCDDNGLDSDGFVESLNEYVYDNHYDDEVDDISKDWQLPYHELVKKVLEELKKEKNYERTKFK